MEVRDELPATVKHGAGGIGFRALDNAAGSVLGEDVIAMAGGLAEEESEETAAVETAVPGSIRAARVGLGEIAARRFDERGEDIHVLNEGWIFAACFDAGGPARDGGDANARIVERPLRVRHAAALFAEK